MFDLTIDESSPIPKHRQICDQYRSAILTGQLPPGTRLPTQSEFRERWSVHIATLARAMDPLEREGLVISKRAAGRYVADRIPKMSESERRKRLIESARLFSVAVSPLGYPESDLISEIKKHLQKGHKR